MNGTPPEHPGEIDQDFLDATAHVPGEVTEDHSRDFADVNTQPAGEVLPPGAPAGPNAWTAPEVAAVFSGIFTLLVMARVIAPFGGEHWNIPNDKCTQLGTAMLPVFCRFVPKPKGDINWLPEIIMWIGALGALKMVCGDAIAIEWKNYKLERLKAAQKARSTTAQSSTGSTGTGTSPASSARPGSAEAERPSTPG